jgi:prepilin-type N-terminal cleavage/methylation domain-containing protein
LKRNDEALVQLAIAFLHFISMLTHKPSFMPTSLQRLGFTLIELLIVISIVGVLLTVVVINMGSSASMAVSMATQDSLRIIRYARNMALQTQQPINVLFTQGKIEIIPQEIRHITQPSSTSLKEDDTDVKALHNETSNTQLKDPNRLEAGTFDELALVKYYQNVNFKFTAYNDNIRLHNNNQKRAHNEFERRINIDASPENTDNDGISSFTLTINANGTMRPCTFQVYACDETGEGESASGNTVSFDFLCTGTIAEE